MEHNKNNYVQKNIDPSTIRDQIGTYIDMKSSDILKVFYDVSISYDKDTGIILVSDGKNSPFPLSRDNYFLGKDGKVYKALNKKGLRMMYPYDPSRGVYVFENLQKSHKNPAPYKIMTNALLQFNKDVENGLYQVLSCDVHDREKKDRSHRLFKGESYFVDLGEKNSYRFVKKSATMYDQNGQITGEFPINHHPMRRSKNKES